MKTLAYPPVYVAVFALHALTAGTIALARFGSPGRIALVCAGLYAVALACGYVLARRSFVAGNATQAVQAIAVGAIGLAWFSFSGLVGLFVVVGLALLLARDATLTTRRALYFDLSILLALFYDAIGAEGLPWRWAIAVAFLLGLVVLLMADFTERRLERLELGTSKARLVPGMRNAAFSTALVLIVAAVIYFLMPQPRALELALVPDMAPPKSWSVGAGDKNDPVHAGENPQGPGRNGGQVGGKDGQANGKGASGGASQGSAGAGGQGGSAGKGSASGKAEARESDSGAPSAAGEGPVAFFDMIADRPLYLRTHAYSLPGPDGWRETPRKWIATSHGELARVDGERGNVHQWFRVLRQLDERIPVAYDVARIRFPADGYHVNRDDTLLAPRPIAPDTVYRAASVVRYLGERASGGPEEAPPAQYLLLPKEVSPNVRDLAREIAQGRTVPSERAAALEQYLRTQYKAGAFKPRSGIDPSEQFLFETKAGASRQFAEALAVMLRSIGIPARIMSGYRARRENPLLGAYEVWPTDRHHWVEAYIEHGWVTFEPSPWATLPAKTGAASAWAAAREFVRLAREPATDALLAGEPIPEVATWYLALVLAYGWIVTYGPLTALLLIAFAAAAQRWRWWSRPLRDALDRLRLRYARSGDPAHVVRRAYAAVERLASRRGHARGRGENHAEYLRRLTASRPHLRLPCDTLAAQFGVARYGRLVTADGAQDALRAAQLIASLIDERT